MDLILTWYAGRYLCTLRFDTSLVDFDPDSRSQECEKAKLLHCHSYFTKFSIDLNGIWYTVEINFLV